MGEEFAVNIETQPCDDEKAVCNSHSFPGYFNICKVLDKRRVIHEEK